ncbi:hypothetical protein C436_21450 [Haloarcula marismortui ATCC 33800]|uniref:Uncharacterized protein n=1 Tax=Haloarcula marismortui ATCC 33800 TaxID=662476 RepID=M0JE84_9EURY|nr:hypothetical protein C436_21450 [Haloarcula sinaiiensis ATCC 33800]
MAAATATALAKSALVQLSSKVRRILRTAVTSGATLILANFRRCQETTLVFCSGTQSHRISLPVATPLMAILALMA